MTDNLADLVITKLRAEDAQKRALTNKENEAKQQLLAAALEIADYLSKWYEGSGANMPDVHRRLISAAAEVGKQAPHGS